MMKTFTIGEAQTLLPVLEALLKRAQGLAARAHELEFEMQHLGQRIYLAGGMHVDVVAAARRRCCSVGSSVRRQLPTGMRRRMVPTTASRWMGALPKASGTGRTKVQGRHSDTARAAWRPPS